ncbi:VCBS domain-containing protein [Marinomonas pontica]|uniref:VCBS domain-containing protein n=1 Tax=Marinomonas pontica TaxID=264739 RepID=UPI002244AFB2|nr:VCBS domain-containing protein [Marinomonas pontica]MCW8356561.1 VCBS domain-containing protein [Marinomonas pontica]
MSVKGADDVATIDSTTVATGEVTEDAATTTVSGDIDASDIDTLDASLSYSLDTTAGTYGSISINEETGEWTYTINNDAAATQALNNGQTETETFTVTVTNNDGETITQEITVSVKGADDVATIDSTTVATGEVTEDAATTTVSGDIDASDIDTLDASLSYSLDTTAGTYGSISINEETGEWTYTINNDAAATQALNNGQTETETFTVTVTNNDGETITQEITVSVKGADDVCDDR